MSETDRRGGVAEDASGDEIILEHFRREAREHELRPSSTMADQTTRALEVDAVLACVGRLAGAEGRPAGLLEVGCGNGYLLGELRGRFPALRLTGIDYSPDMVALASRRGIEGCEIRRGDVRALDLPPSSFQVAVSERCLINLLDEGSQAAALRELHRVLEPGGHLILIEAFTDGAANLNRARDELGLPENPPPHHNLWFDKGRFLSIGDGLFEVRNDGEGADPALPPRNFLSTHYFISRVLYPSVTRREVLYNTEFVRFFRFLPPEGDYSPIQLYVLRKLG